MHRTLAPALVLWLCGCLCPALMGLALAGCGGNACQDLQERVAECLGADQPGGEDIPDEECTDDFATESECLLDQSCESLNSGEAYVTCAPGS
ncbi:MAG: hypothetical protein WKG00_06885 [Polyangiaceae bacterium]